MPPDHEPDLERVPNEAAGLQDQLKLQYLHFFILRLGSKNQQQHYVCMYRPANDIKKRGNNTVGPPPKSKHK